MLLLLESMVETVSRHFPESFGYAERSCVYVRTSPPWLGKLWGLVPFIRQDKSSQAFSWKLCFW